MATLYRGTLLEILLLDGSWTAFNRFPRKTWNKLKINVLTKGYIQSCDPHVNRDPSFVHPCHTHTHTWVYSKFPSWPLGARTANGTVFCHLVQLCPYFVNQSSEFCRHNTLCCFSTNVHCCKRIFRCRLSPETFRYTLVYYYVDFRSMAGLYLE